MKIAIVSRVYSLTWGGAERVVVSLSQKLAETGHEVHIFCGRAEGIIPKGVKLHIVPFIKTVSPVKLLTFQWSVYHLIKNDSFDLVYGLCQFFPIDAYYAGGGVYRHWMKLRYPSKWLRLFKYLFSPGHLSMLWIEKEIFRDRNFKFVVTNSLLVKKHVLEYFSISEDRVRVIYDGIDHRVFNPEVRKDRQIMRKKYGLSNNDVVVLFISNNWFRKGLITILKSLKTLPPEIKTVVVGRGNPKRFKKEAKRIGVEDSRVIFTGPTKEVEKFYGMADIFVLPTMYDPFANVCREAMACGLPVITTKMNGASEIILQGKNGYILKSWDQYDDLSIYILELRDPNLREDMGRKAFESVQSHTWERNIEEHISLFKELRVE